MKIKLWDKELEYIESGENRGEFNMDFDADCAAKLEQGVGDNIFRLYSWKPWCVSLGYNQKKEDISEELCKKEGFDIVRRPTGGRAVLHADELTYSIIIKLSDKLTKQDVYRDIHLFFIKVFSKLGADLDFVKNNADFNKFYKDKNLSFACFASSARYEVTKGGKKIIGSAQRVTGDTLLQHGSILIGAGHEQIVNVIPFADEEKKNRAKEFLHNNTITLSDAVGRKLTIEEVISAIKSSLMA